MRTRAETKNFCLRFLEGSLRVRLCSWIFYFTQREEREKGAERTKRNRERVSETQRFKPLTPALPVKICLRRKKYTKICKI